MEKLKYLLLLVSFNVFAGIMDVASNGGTPGLNETIYKATFSYQKPSELKKKTENKVFKTLGLDKETTITAIAVGASIINRNFDTKYFKGLRIDVTEKIAIVPGVEWDMDNKEEKGYINLNYGF